MAIPNITISIVPVNQVTIKSTEGIDIPFTLEKCNDIGDGFITYIITPPLDNDMIIPTNGTIIIPLSDDIYKISFQDTIDPNTYYSYYFIADQNIKACKRKLLIKNLCNTSTCDPIANCNYLNERMKFYDLEMGLYYIYSKFIKRQSLTMLVVPTNQELMTKKDFLKQLLDMCSCANNNCQDCSDNSILNMINNITPCGNCNQ